MGKGQGSGDGATTRAEITGAICDRLARGESVASVFRTPGADYPSENTFWRWVNADPELRKLYELGVERRGEKYAEEIVEIMDAAGSPLLHPETGEPILRDGKPVMVVDRVAVEHAKARADARKWVASRLLPKRYGDRTTIAGDADNPLAIDVTDARGALLRGLAPKPTGSGEGGAG